ncbi:hypothetical protein BDB00DRAFT_845100 [Zychaea mexicana]|uniref:uncharacterized protein n=1 Tax=Zychaea mexicana TaxID=64656 RepID=UPI0022FEF2DA|nr:uncharacterized protein BDB00DRAFT_845100 [Zychaea mexicana]KAI9489073.1 hypothetical protein BDB00DRAFT_845100 [Zychaea mexicana]
MNPGPQSSSAMSISAITTAPIFPPSPPPSASSVSHQSYYPPQHHRQEHPLKQQQQQQPHEQKHHHLHHQQQLGSPPTSPEDMSPPTSPQFSHELHGMAPLTLQERRMRNKAASAKYRQKKNQQQNEMRQMICRLSEHNAVLERQLQELRMDNERLRSSADRLRGKMVAKKMLRQWIGRHQHQQQRKEQPPSTSSSPSSTSSSAFQAVSKKQHHYHPYAATAAAAAAAEEDDGLELDFDEDDVCLDD